LGATYLTRRINCIPYYKTGFLLIWPLATDTIPKENYLTIKNMVWPRYSLQFGCLMYSTHSVSGNQYSFTDEKSLEAIGDTTDGMFLKPKNKSIIRHLIFVPKKELSYV